VFLNDQGYLLRKADSGESHLLLVVFLQENGLRHVLARKRTRPQPGSHLPDLFDLGEFSIEQKDPARPAFLREFSPSRRFEGISRHYANLTAASRLTRFYERNLIHLEHFAPVWELLGQALQGLAEKPEPELILFKALYVFARSEGYPVRAQWLESRPRDMREAMLTALRAAPGDQPLDKEVLREWTADLCRFFQNSTDLLPPDLP